MALVTRFDWTVETGSRRWSGTDDIVLIEIRRDQDLIQRLRLETGGTERLDRGENTTYLWGASYDTGQIQVVESSTAHSGFMAPPHWHFDQGIRGHLIVKLIAKGNDAWEVLDILSTVHSGFVRAIPGTIDGMEWVRRRDKFTFRGRDVLSADSSEGISVLNLRY